MGCTKKLERKRNEQKMMHLLDGRRVRMNVNRLHIPWYWEIS